MGHMHHDHDHTHIHEHSHDHHHETSGTSEVRTLLEYMIHHNEHHNEELADLLDQLPRAAQKKLITAIGSFEAANVELKAVLEYLD